MKEILITGATGQLGLKTIEFLLGKGIEPGKISALVRDPNKAQKLTELGVNLIIGDYGDYESLVKAFQEVNKLLFVSSSDVPNRVSQHENVIKAAVEAKVNHVFYTSALTNSSIENSAIAFVSEAHVKTEEWLAASGLPYTLLKNNLYMELVPQFIGDQVLETGTIYFPAGTGKTGFALRTEMAEATANVLASEGHAGKSYEITNVEAYTYQDVANCLTEIAGKVITYISPSVEEFTGVLKNAGLSDEMIGGVVSFALAQANEEFNVTGADLEYLLGRKPTSLNEYLISIYQN